MDHFSHEHPLVLNEDYIARGGDVCDACNDEIVSCKSFVYSCSRSIIMGIPSPYASEVDENCFKFLLHKTCAELPRKIENPRNPKEFLVLHIIRKKIKYLGFGYVHPVCDMCYMEMPWNYCSPKLEFLEFVVCLKCAMSQIRNHKFKHPAHSQHPLALIQRPSSFKCDACNVKNNTEDMSYKCIDCPFWMHKSCADAPTSFLFHFHKKHPLILSFLLPEAYQNFTQYCKLCHGRLGGWLYYCPQCRFFAHFHCARSSRMSSFSENELYPDLVHLPPANESSINLLFEQFIKDTSTLENNEEFSTKSRIKDWAHGEHQLQLITTDELNDQKDSDDKLLICDGCAKPIRNDGDSFYACVPCRYFLHKFCGELRRTIDQAYSYSTKPYKFFHCNLCDYPGNCISLYASRLSSPSHIGCLMLPKTIKHESHRHPLYSKSGSGKCCKACGFFLKFQRPFHSCECEGCDFRICARCIMKARTVEHRWDPHPLHLIYDPEMVENHVHGFNCEFCSRELDTNYWFYHCNICDLSFHLGCYDELSHLKYSHIKFGATNIIRDNLHSHSLTFVLNMKFRRCRKCNTGIIGGPVLECAPCKTMFCRWCALELE